MPRFANKSSTSRRLSVEPDRLLDDLWRKTVAAIADFLHPLASEPLAGPQAPNGVTRPVWSLSTALPLEGVEGVGSVPNIGL